MKANQLVTMHKNAHGSMVDMDKCWNVEGGTTFNAKTINSSDLDLMRYWLVDVAVEGN